MIYKELCARVEELEKKIEDDKYELDQAYGDRDDRIRAAARLANALTDINNDIGEDPAVRDRFLAVEEDIENYSGLEDIDSE